MLRAAPRETSTVVDGMEILGIARGAETRGYTVHPVKAVVLMSVAPVPSSSRWQTSQWV